MNPVITAYAHGTPAAAAPAQEPVIDPERLFYATVQSDKRNGFLAGPFETHAQALEAVPDAKQYAEANDPWSCFYKFGTASVPRTLSQMPKGIFNNHFEGVIGK